MNRYLPWLLVSALAPLAATQAATPFDRTVDADARGTVEVHNIAGSVEIQGWDKPSVHVSGTLADNVERADVRRDGNRVVVEVVMREESRSRSYEGTKLTIEAPRASTLEVSGSIDADAFASDVTANAVSGEVTVHGHGSAAVIRARAVSGEVRLVDVAGQVEAQAVSGAVEVAANQVDRVTLSSISGRVSLSGALGDHARADLTTTSGSLNMTFAGTAAAEYDLTTFSGRIDPCFGPPVSEPRNGPQRAHRFREGDSDARVRANSMSGSITLCRK
jgi:autotransporter translocation and assembly factor TamB